MPLLSQTLNTFCIVRAILTQLAPPCLVTAVTRSLHLISAFRRLRIAPKLCRQRGKIGTTTTLVDTKWMTATLVKSSTLTLLLSWHLYGSMRTTTIRSLARKAWLFHTTTLYVVLGSYVPYSPDYCGLARAVHRTGTTMLQLTPY
jgi:hypothetical protein